MKQCDKPNSHINSKLHMIYIYLVIMLDVLLIRPSLNFTILHPITLHFTSSYLNFIQLHFTTLSFSLTPFKFLTAPFHLTSHHYTSLHFTTHADTSLPPN
jgi:hypothetical protein